MNLNNLLSRTRTEVPEKEQVREPEGSTPEKEVEDYIDYVEPTEADTPQTDEPEPEESKPEERPGDTRVNYGTYPFNRDDLVRVITEHPGIRVGEIKQILYPAGPRVVLTRISAYLQQMSVRSHSPRIKRASVDGRFKYYPLDFDLPKEVIADPPKPKRRKPGAQTYSELVKAPSTSVVEAQSRRQEMRTARMDHKAFGERVERAFKEYVWETSSPSTDLRAFLEWFEGKGPDSQT